MVGLAPSLILALSPVPSPLPAFRQAGEALHLLRRRSRDRGTKSLRGTTALCSCVTSRSLPGNASFRERAQHPDPSGHYQTATESTRLDYRRCEGGRTEGRQDWIGRRKAIVKSALPPAAPSTTFGKERRARERESDKGSRRCNSGLLAEGGRDLERAGRRAVAGVDDINNNWACTRPLFDGWVLQ